MKERAADEQKAESQKLKQVFFFEELFFSFTPLSFKKISSRDAHFVIFFHFVMLGHGKAQGSYPKNSRDPCEDRVLLEVLLLRRRPDPHL